MSITSSEFANLTQQVRIRQGSQFQQVPNLIPAAEPLIDGQFVALGSDDKYVKASSTIAATHLVLKSAEPRLTAHEVASYMGTVQTGEPVMAITGQGTVTIPIASTVAKGDQLVVNDSGYASKRTMASIGWVIGYALESIDLDPSEVGFIDAFIELPARYHNANS